MSSLLQTSDIISEQILSRKIAIKSMTRHFAGWKLRLFQLNVKNGILEIHSPDKSSSTFIHLSLPSVSIGRHYYAVDKYKWLWLKYYDKVEKCPKEVIMKFEHEENIAYWEKVSLCFISTVYSR